MERRDLQRVLDYIEAHLKDEADTLDSAALASVACYSKFHFLRAFRDTIRLTPADYIRKRRISEIVRRIGEDNRPMSDIAFEYGFNSKENFTRAFKKEHGILPSEFRAAGCSLRLFSPFVFDPPFAMPEVSLRILDPFSLTVYPFGGAFPPDCWNQYNAGRRSRQLTGRDDAEDFGAMRWNHEKKQLDYFIGVRSADARGDTSGTITLAIDGGLYAVFETAPASRHDFVEIIRRTWDEIERHWLAENGWRRTGGFELESYVESSRKYSERICIPLKKDG